MKYLLDTCTLSYFFRKDPDVIAHFKQYAPYDLSFSAITEMEIEYGLKLNPEREMKLRPLWEELKTSVSIIPFGSKEALYAGSVRAHLRESGKPVGPYDLLIAATAHLNHLVLVTSNIKEFSHTPDLKIENWKKPI